MLARQRGLQDRMRELEAASATVSNDAGGGSEGRRAAAARTAAETAREIPAVGPYAWLSQLRDTAGARRAIVLREVLGPPVAFR